MFLHACRHHHTSYATSIVDLDRSQLLGVVPGRSGRVLGDWLDTQSQDWRDQITVAAIDPFRRYPNAMRSRLPDATLVVDYSDGLSWCLFGGSLQRKSSPTLTARSGS